MTMEGFTENANNETTEDICNFSNLMYHFLHPNTSFSQTKQFFCSMKLRNCVHFIVLNPLTNKMAILNSL